MQRVTRLSWAGLAAATLGVGVLLSGRAPTLRPSQAPPVIDDIEVVVQLDGLVRRCKEWRIADGYVTKECGDDVDSLIVTRDLKTGRTMRTRVKVQQLVGPIATPRGRGP